jgi:hypothetical protein
VLKLKDTPGFKITLPAGKTAVIPTHLVYSYDHIGINGGFKSNDRKPLIHLVVKNKYKL